MIVFDLKCSQGHHFEGWFDGAEDLERQLRGGLVACPACGDDRVRRVPSSFAIAKTGRNSDGPNQETVAKMLGQALQRHLRENFDDVGPQFAAEALKIHYGVGEPRNIRGVSTPHEEKMLMEEGVEFFKVAAGPAPPAEDGGDED